MKNVYFYETKIGRVGIADNGEAITELFFAGESDTGNRAEGENCAMAGEVRETTLIRKAAEQLCEYLAGERKGFDIPLAAEGTQFQRDVWKALTGIPYGQTRSYRQIAESIGNPKACRAVGMANNRNPIAVIVPCHRVIGADGKLVGYAGGLDVKKKLLDMERERLDFEREKK